MKQEDKNRNYELAEKLLAEQNFAAAVIVGVIAAVVAAAVYTIAGCLLGNVFRVVSPLDVFRSNDFSLIASQTVSYISFVDLVFWFVAIFAAVFLAMRPLSRSDKLAIGMYELND